MNSKELKVEMIRNDISIPKLAEKIGISKKAMYSKISGQSSFNQREISAIADVLELSNERLCEIFFKDLVS